MPFCVGIPRRMKWHPQVTMRRSWLLWQNLETISPLLFVFLPTSAWLKWFQRRPIGNREDSPLLVSGGKKTKKVSKCPVFHWRGSSIQFQMCEEQSHFRGMPCPNSPPTRNNSRFFFRPWEQLTALRKGLPVMFKLLQSSFRFVHQIFQIKKQKKM